MRMPFGKHRRLLLREIPTDYLEWLADTCDLKPRLRRAVELELDRREEEEETEPIYRSPARVTWQPILREWYRGLAIDFHPDRGGRDRLVETEPGSARGKPSRHWD
jgi:hypothetical protein